MTSHLWPDIETWLMNWLQAQFPAVLPTNANTGTEWPADLSKRLVGGKAFVGVYRIGGADDGISDFPVVDLDFFAARRPVAYDLAEGARARLLASPHRTDDGLVDRVLTATAPVQRPWADVNVVRYYSTYNLSARR